MTQNCVAVCAVEAYCPDLLHWTSILWPLYLCVINCSCLTSLRSLVVHTCFLTLSEGNNAWVNRCNLVIRVFEFKVMCVLCIAAQQTRIGGGQPCGGGKVQLPTSNLQQQFSPFPQLHWSSLCCEYSHSASSPSLTNNLHTLSPPSLLIIQCSMTSFLLGQNRTLSCHGFLICLWIRKLDLQWSVKVNQLIMHLLNNQFIAPVSQNWLFYYNYFFDYLFFDNCWDKTRCLITISTLITCDEFLFTLKYF